MTPIVVALIAALPATLAALAAWRNHAQVKSPNGIPTGKLVYDAWKRIQNVEVQQAEHLAKDDARFDVIFNHLDLDDPHG